MSDDMVTKMARAICCPRGCVGSPCHAYQVELAALAALEAMREPTAEMAMEGSLADDYGTPQSACAEIYTAMIDAALKEHKG